ncbi:MAG: pyridoxamine 5'-phosphate oxidase family protein [Gammaproteobacteria bacterium]|nr:pyridoxamine 5'-phosphate oxidase family protein [Gammaproteobacteria bacterium]
MGRIHQDIDATLAAWMTRQQMFFVATAPLAADGLVNCSPKGLDTLRIVSPTEIVWLDVGGSGIETVAHLKENGRIVLMFCAFEGAPRIVRCHGRGEVVERNHADFARLLALFPPPPVCRALVRIEVGRVADSCGWGVPLYEFRQQRDDIARAVAGMTTDELRAQAERQNSRSLDGLPGLDIDALDTNP